MESTLKSVYMIPRGAVRGPPSRDKGLFNLLLFYSSLLSAFITAPSRFTKARYLRVLQYYLQELNGDVCLQKHFKVPTLQNNY